MADIKVGHYVVIAIPDEDERWAHHDEYNAQPPDKRLNIINPIRPHDRQTGENCYINRMSKPITRCFVQVVGVKDGVMVKVIQKGHPRGSEPSDLGSRLLINLNNILDKADTRDEMIVKRNLMR